MSTDLTTLHEELSRSPEFAVHDMMDQVRYQLRRRMDETGMTQAELAEAMGVKPPTVSRLLRAAENTSLLTIARAARALGLTFHALKLVPDEQSAHQLKEFRTFIATEGSGRAWWPRTCAPATSRIHTHASRARTAGSNPIRPSSLASATNPPVAPAGRGLRTEPSASLVFEADPVYG